MAYSLLLLGYNSVTDILKKSAFFALFFFMGYGLHVSLKAHYIYKNNLKYDLFG